MPADGVRAGAGGHTLEQRLDGREQLKGRAVYVLEKDPAAAANRLRQRTGLPFELPGDVGADVGTQQDL